MIIVVAIFKVTTRTKALFLMGMLHRRSSDLASRFERDGNHSNQFTTSPKRSRMAVYAQIL